MYTVYVLRSLKNGRRYTGHTDNLERRIKEHNSGHTKSTKNVAPFEVIYTEQYPSKIEANRRELELKSGKGREWLNAILG